MERLDAARRPTNPCLAARSRLLPLAEIDRGKDELQIVKTNPVKKTILQLT
jgi:hypothetical protein